MAKNARGKSDSLARVRDTASKSVGRTLTAQTHQPSQSEDGHRVIAQGIQVEPPWIKWLDDIQVAVLCICRRFTLSQGVSNEDVLQDTFRRLLQRQVPLQRKPAVRFACHIARHICIDHLRWKSRDRLALQICVRDINDNAAWEAFVERRIFLLDLMETLHNRDKQIIREFFVKQKSLTEVSKMFGISERTCRTWTLALFDRLPQSRHPRKIRLISVVVQPSS